MVGAQLNVRDLSEETREKIFSELYKMGYRGEELENLIDGTVEELGRIISLEPYKEEIEREQEYKEMIYYEPRPSQYRGM